MDISIVIPVFNQLHFTKICLKSLRETVPSTAQIVVIDNGSTDGTAEYLAAYSNITVITNTKNLGCAVAWNQGVKAARKAWIIIMNNDIVTSPNWLEGLFDFVREENMDIVSPAFREGEYNYDIVEYSKDYIQRMHSVARMGIAQGICFMVRWRVFEQIGFFDENFRIGQFEDADFFRRARLAGFGLGTTGRSFIHHFGSITQNSLRKKGPKSTYEQENRAYYRKKYRLTLWKRFLERRHAKLQAHWWRISERMIYGHSLIEKWIDGRLHYF
jgi:GT2 family glycosyltransferase